MHSNESFVLAFGSNVEDGGTDYQQDLFSSLIGTMHELTPADDSNTRFQPTFRTRKEYSSIEGFRPNDPQDDLAFISMIIPQEKILSRHERSVTWMFESAQTSSMDGSGLEGSK